MVGASKILTVSYGTFSCTLEGFDEPFSTMKAIAEYFRDLAADDRYFGATPPTPDAEMLHRIAEREVQRRVEAKISEHGIVLRPERDDAALSPAALAHERAATPAAAAEVSTSAWAHHATEPAKPSIPESVAAKLMRIRAVVKDSAKAEAPKSEAPYEEDEATAEFAAAASAPVSEFGFDLDLGDVPGLKATHHEDALEHDAAAEVEEGSADASEEAVPAVAEDALAEDETATLDLAEPQDDEAGVVVFETMEATDATEEEPLEVISAEMSDEMESDVPAVEEDAAPVAALEEAETAEDEDWAEVAAEHSEVEDEPAAASEKPLDLSAFRAEDERPETGAVDATEAAADEEFASLRAKVIHIRGTDADEYEDDVEDDDLAAAFDMADDGQIEDRTAAVMAALSESDYEDDFEETAQDETDEGDDKEILAQIGAAIGDTGLPDEDEQELLRDLADVARDLRRDSHEGRAILESASDDDEASVERLMEEAKSKLEGVENRRRFSAIAHLKAAVAATVADRKMKSGDAGVVAKAAEPQDDTERYRDDLSKAVRPRRPTSDSVPTTQRPTFATRLAPLVLVSEQRVDAHDETRQDTAVVRPRRIHAAALDTTVGDDMDEDDDVPANPEDARSFAEFAERLGADSLPELLEAAAAYTSTVEGITHFSRPQIIKKIAHMSEEEDYSREDSLRSFGMLLRQGKIQKVRRGQFMLTEASRYMDEAQRAAN